jgi:galactokinase
MNLNDLISDIENYEVFIFSNLTFNLYYRLYFLIRENARIDRIYLCQTDSNEFFENVILSEIANSNLDLNKYYDCYTNNINAVIKVIEDVKCLSYTRLASNGWTGQVFTISKRENISKITEHVLEYYRKAEENPEQSNVVFWISDEITRYYYCSAFGGSAAILDPTYEDFMI